MTLTYHRHQSQCTAGDFALTYIVRPRRASSSSFFLFSYGFLSLYSKLSVFSDHMIHRVYTTLSEAYGEKRSFRRGEWNVGCTTLLREWVQNDDIEAETATGTATVAFKLALRLCFVSTRASADTEDDALVDLYCRAAFRAVRIGQRLIAPNGESNVRKILMSSLVEQTRPDGRVSVLVSHASRSGRLAILARELLSDADFSEWLVGQIQRLALVQTKDAAAWLCSLSTAVCGPRNATPSSSWMDRLPPITLRLELAAEHWREGMVTQRNVMSRILQFSRSDADAPGRLLCFLLYFPDLARDMSATETQRTCRGTVFGEDILGMPWTGLLGYRELLQKVTFEDPAVAGIVRRCHQVIKCPTTQSGLPMSPTGPGWRPVIGGHR